MISADPRIPKVLGWPSEAIMMTDFEKEPLKVGDEVIHVDFGSKANTSIFYVYDYHFLMIQRHQKRKIKSVLILEC